MNHTHLSSENLAVLPHTLQTNKHMYDVYSDLQHGDGEMVGHVDAMEMYRCSMFAEMACSEPTFVRGRP